MPVKAKKQDQRDQNPATVEPPKNPKRGPKPGGWRDDPDALAKAQREALMRRVLLMDLRVKGMSDPHEIADELKVDVSTIYKDLKVLDDWFKEQAVEQIAVLKGQDLVRIEKAIGYLWPKVQKGQVTAIRALVELLQRRARLLGLDAPTNLNLSWEVEAKAQGIDPDTFFQVVVGAIMAMRQGQDVLPLLAGPSTRGPK